MVLEKVYDSSVVLEKAYLGFQSGSDLSAISLARKRQVMLFFSQIGYCDPDIVSISAKDILP